MVYNGLIVKMPNLLLNRECKCFGLLQEGYFRDVPGGPMAATPCFQDREAWVRSLVMRQEIDGPRTRYLHLASCLHFLGQKKCGLQAGHLKLASCLHFLKQGLGGLRARCLQPAFCFLSEIKETETG